MKPSRSAPFVLMAMLAAALARPAVAQDFAAQHAASLQLAPAAPLTADELAKLLDVAVWKFTVSLPESAKSAEVLLSLKEKGRGAKTFFTRGFAAGVSGPVDQSTPRELLVAILPLNGSLNDAEKLRVVIQGLNLSAAGAQDNPSKHLGLGRSETPEANPDCSDNLIGGYAGSSIAMPISGADQVLGVRIEVK